MSFPLLVQGSHAFVQRFVDRAIAVASVLLAAYWAGGEELSDSTIIARARVTDIANDGRVKAAMGGLPFSHNKFGL
jgi:hypothetical protein